MPDIVKTITTDERTWQEEFYKSIFGEEYTDYITVDRSTDGYTKGIIFEHKTNIRSYGTNKALSQALVYLTRFNRDGIPVPAKICLVSQDECKCYIYNTIHYLEYVNDIPLYANLKASDGIAGFSAGVAEQIINFNLSSAIGMKDLLSFVQQRPKNVKVDINVHNVYGWANYYYEHAIEYGQKPEKKKFFDELRAPVGTLKDFINPWTGAEIDFKYIMDILNDPATQHDLGAYYTPKHYAKKSTELVKQAIERVPEGNDYIILDRCAGTGNLEMFLDDEGEDILSHVVLSTYELKEWIVLKDRYAGRVRYIIPPIPKSTKEFPKLNTEGFLTGANALTKEIIENPNVRKYLDDPKCTIILYENPPIVESKEIVKNNDITIVQKKEAKWKQFDITKEMSEKVSGVALNDMGNAFIWSGFEYFLRQPTDSFITFGPPKYWKAHHLVNKKFLGGFAFNRKHFHSDSGCFTCIMWSNEDDIMTNEIELEAYDIEKDKLIRCDNIILRRVYSTFSDKYFDNRSFDNDTAGGIICEINGTESNKSTSGVVPVSNENILAYLVAYKNTFDSPRYCSMLLRGAIYNGHGFYLRSDNFAEKLPLFAASRYTDNCNNWQIMSMIMKSGDKAEQYNADLSSGKLNKFLCQTLIWTCLTHYAHMRSFVGRDGELYRNELCFDSNNQQKTLASIKLDEFKSMGYKLSTEELHIFEKWNEIKEYAKQTEEYNPQFTYGLFQIDEEINIKIQQGFKADGSPKMVTKYGNLNNSIKDLIKLLKEYYIKHLVPTLFEYEFLK